jgi:hypothetical protein
MSNAIYFERESPDYNFGLNGKIERLAANRVILCLLTEYGLSNDCRMQIPQINRFIRNIQSTSIIRK